MSSRPRAGSVNFLAESSASSGNFFALRPRAGSNRFFWKSVVPLRAKVHGRLCSTSKSEVRSPCPRGMSLFCDLLYTSSPSGVIAGLVLVVKGPCS